MARVVHGEAGTVSGSSRVYAVLSAVRLVPACSPVRALLDEAWPDLADAGQVTVSDIHWAREHSLVILANVVFAFDAGVSAVAERAPVSSWLLNLHSRRKSHTAMSTKQSLATGETPLVVAVGRTADERLVVFETIEILVFELVSAAVVGDKPVAEVVGIVSAEAVLENDVAGLESTVDFAWRAAAAAISMAVGCMSRKWAFDSMTAALDRSIEAWRRVYGFATTVADMSAAASDDIQAAVPAHSAVRSRDCLHNIEEHNLLDKAC